MELKIRTGVVGVNVANSVSGRAEVLRYIGYTVYATTPYLLSLLYLQLKKTPSV